MPADPTTKSLTAARKRPAQHKRGAIACVRCKERKAKCVPAPIGSSAVPTCTNCLSARAECVYLDRTPNELFLLEYVSQLEARIADLELELAKYTASPDHQVDHTKTQAAAIESLTQQYPPGTWPVNGAAVSVSGGVGLDPVSGPSDETSPSVVKDEPPDNQEDLAYGLGLLSLSGSGEPVYVGESSGVNWARVCAQYVSSTSATRFKPGSSHNKHNSKLQDPPIDPQLLEEPCKEAPQTLQVIIAENESSALRGPPKPAGTTSNLSKFNYLAPPESSSIESAVLYSQHHPIPPLPLPHLADRYLEAAYQHIQARYGFLDWPTVKNWHENREAICLNRPLWGVGRGKDHRRTIAAFTLWLIYGYGARLTEDEHLEGAVSHEVYHNIAVACLSNVTIHTSLATVQAELLLTIYSFRHPAPEISVWQTAGLALRLAVQIGLHRRARTKTERENNPHAYEVKKRTFWTIYTIDRMLALQLGRPSGIQDRDIDIEMPLNIDVELTDANEILRMQNAQIEATKGVLAGDEYLIGYGSVTSMTSAIHNTRLNQLKQTIQDAIYRLDQPIEQRASNAAFRSDNLPDVDNVLSRLSQWQAASPVLPPGRSRIPLLSIQQSDMEYHNCVQMLLRPVISGRLASERYLQMCFDSAASLCEIQWGALSGTGPQLRLSNWALYRLFLSGLTLLHLASSPLTAVFIDLHRAKAALIRCKDSLAIYVRHLPAMKGYLDVFKDLVTGWESKFGPTLASAPQATSGGSRAVSGAVGSNTSQVASNNSMGEMQNGIRTSDPMNWLNSISGQSQGADPVRLHIPLQPVNPTRQSNIQQPPRSTSHQQPTFSGTPYSPFNQVSQPNNKPHNQVSPPPTSQQNAGSTPQSTQQSSSMGPQLHQRHTQALQQQAMYTYPGEYEMQNGSGNALPGMAEFFAGMNNPQIEQLGGGPGGGVRDDFQSLLSSLGVDMGQSLGNSLPPLAEDHLWTSDWGMMAPPPDTSPHDSAQHQPSLTAQYPYTYTDSGWVDYSAEATGFGNSADMNWFDGEYNDGQNQVGVGPRNGQGDDLWKFPFA